MPCKDLPARISAFRALTSALSSAMSCDSRLGSSIALSLCGGCFHRRGACRRNLRKSQKPTQGERPPITNAWIASPPVRNQRRPRPKPAPGKTATPTQENQERAQPRALRVADSVSVASEQQQRDGEPDSSQNFIVHDGLLYSTTAPGGSKPPLLRTIRRLCHKRPRSDPSWRGGHTP